MQPHLQAAPADPPGVIKKYLVDAARILAWGAYAALVYVVLVRGLQLARDTAFPLTIGKIGWGEIDPPLQIWFPLFPVAFALALLLPLATKYCIAFIVSIKGKDALSRWAKGILILITLACVISTLTATGPLMVESYSDKYREAAVNGELVDARRDAEQANYDRMAESLKTMQTGTSVESAAAREGVAGWSAKVAIAKKQLDAGQLPQARYDRIERAGSAAAAREDLERKMQEQQVKIATLPTASTAVASVHSDESHGVQEFSSVASAYWPLVSFFALEMIAVFFGLIQLVLEMTRDRQLADYEASQAKDAEKTDWLQISDQTDKPAVMPQETILEEDPETGELVEKIRERHKNEDYFRKKPSPRKPKAAKVDSRAPVIDPMAEPEQIAVDELDTQKEVASAQDELRLAESGSDISGRGEELLAPDPDTDNSEGDLTHAQENQQAENPEEETQADVGELPREDVGSGASSDDEPHDLEQHEGEQAEIVDAAPLETPDEQVTWEEIPEEPEPETSVQISDREALELEAEYQRLRYGNRAGLPAPKEAAE